MKRLPSIKRRRRRRAVKRRPINVLASVLTSFGLYCGISSIFATIQGEYENAAYWILGALVFDMLDGTIAKLTKSVSEFGKQLDSLCDLVSFGTAPAALIYKAHLHEPGAADSWVGRTGSVVAIVFVICGALRLARFNVYQSERRDYFVGLPIPAAGATIAAFVLFTQYFEISVRYGVLVPVTLGLAYLMVSTVRYPKDKLKFFVFAPRNAFRILAICVIGIAVFHYARTYSLKIVLLPVMIIYLFFGLGDELLLRLHRRSLHVQTQAKAEGAGETPPDHVSESPPP